MIFPPLSVLEFLSTACYILIFTYFWRLLAARWADRPIGRGMAAVYS